MQNQFYDLDIQEGEEVWGQKRSNVKSLMANYQSIRSIRLILCLQVEPSRWNWKFCFFKTFKIFYDVMSEHMQSYYNICPNISLKQRTRNVF